MTVKYIAIAYDDAQDTESGEPLELYWDIINQFHDANIKAVVVGGDELGVQAMHEAVEFVKAGALA